MEPGDIIIDGGNSYYKDDVRRSRELGEKKIRYVDVGTSGGIWGIERGYSIMIGGDEDIVRYLDPIFKSFAPGVSDIAPTAGRENRKGTAEGRWTIMAAVEEAVPAPVLSSALYARFRSRQEHTYANRVLSAMRSKFGGHVEPSTGS